MATAGRLPRLLNTLAALFIVLAGLKIGDQVVAAGGAWLYDGMQVRPLGDG